jgi:hypothetical protein
MSIEARLAKLEVEARRWRMLAIGLLIVAVVAVSAAAQLVNDRVVMIKKLELMNKNSGLGGEIAMDGEAMVFKSISKGKTTVLLELTPKAEEKKAEN